MWWRTSWLLCLSGLFLVLAGCQRLHHEKTWTIPAGEAKYLEVVDAPSGEQKIEVQVTATEPVAVFVVLEDQLREFDRKSGTFDQTKALKSKKGVRSETIQATIPAGKKYGVVVMPQTNKSEVKVILDGR